MNKPLTLLLLLCAAALPAMTTLADPVKTLEDAGLSRTGMEYVIPEETEIIRARTEIKKAQRALKDAEKDFRSAEKKIGKAQAYIAHLQREIEEMKDKVRRSDDQKEYARNMKAYDALVASIEKAQADRKEFEEKQQIKIDDAKAAYIATMVTWVQKAAAVQDKYDELAKNEDINNAIKTVSEQDKRKYVLGPSRSFQSINRELTKAAGEYQRGAVDLRKEHNTLHIDVRINGKPIRSMILDTGASSVSLPFMFAKDLGINPGASDPVVQVQMADGKIVDAWKMTLESVQVGEFIVNDVEALVLPESLHAAPALLGNTFLGNFTFEVDPDRGKLILSRLTKEE
ncbi:MAG: TIGR02281 family clan AA aspartic protease [Phycisphaeraceae bacterium]|nr:TIGR02281 family clan AA aspartic protease [Phycisphaeraceae bacterium]